MVMVVRSGNGVPYTPPVAPSQVVYPDNANVGYSDYAILSATHASARFTRYADPYGQGFDYCAPGARVRMRSNSRMVFVNLRYTNLVTRADVYNGTGAILVNGTIYQTFTRAQGAAGNLTVPIDFGSQARRTVEVVMPYCASVDFLSFSIDATAVLEPPPPRPVTRCVLVGDSITQGFFASRVDLSWPYLFAASQGAQLVNMGYGSHQVLPAVVQAAAGLSPTIGLYLIGYNEFAHQNDPATMKATYKTALTNWRAAAPAAKLYCITPTYSPNVLSIPLESYRQAIRDALTELADPLNILVEGAALATNDSVRFPDGVHPSDLGSAEIAANLLTAIPSPYSYRAGSLIDWSAYGQLTLPISSIGDGTADLVEYNALPNAGGGSYASEFFWIGPTGGAPSPFTGASIAAGETVLKARVDDTGRTATSTHPRSEMRQELVLGSTSGSSNWSFTDGKTHTQTGIVRVTSWANKVAGSTDSRVAVGQMHVKETSDPPMFVWCEKTGAGTMRVRMKYRATEGGGDAYSQNNIALNTGDTFAYRMIFTAGVGTLDIATGLTNLAGSWPFGGTVTRLNDSGGNASVNFAAGYTGRTYYFKAGDYNQDDDTNFAAGTGTEVVYNRLTTVHA